MSTNNEEPAKRAALADDEVKSLLAQIADAVRKGSERERSFADKFWERMASVSTFVGSVVLGAVALMFNSAYNDQQAKQGEAQFDLEQHKFENEQESQRRATLMQIIPDLFGADEAKREGAQALLLEFYPNEAKGVLERVAATHPEQKEQIAAVIERASERSAEIGTWGVVMGHDQSHEAANAVAERAREEKFAAGVYKKGHYFVTVAHGRLGQAGTGFANEDDAESANFEISSVVRNGTYVVPLKTWCENPQPAGDAVVQCANK